MIRLASLATLAVVCCAPAFAQDYNRFDHYPPGYWSSEEHRNHERWEERKAQHRNYEHWCREHPRDCR